jgi:hypothetical protein
MRSARTRAIDPLISQMGLVQTIIAFIGRIARFIATHLLFLLSPVPFLGTISRVFARFIGIDPFAIKPVKVPFVSPPTIVKDLVTVPLNTLEKLGNPVQVANDIGKHIDSQIESVEKDLSIEKERLSRETQTLTKPVVEVKEIIHDISVSSVKTLEKVSSSIAR